MLQVAVADSSGVVQVFAIKKRDVQVSAVFWHFFMVVIHRNMVASHAFMPSYHFRQVVKLSCRRATTHCYK